MYQDLMVQVIEAQAKYNLGAQPPCPANRVEELRRRARRELRAELPEEYAAFLRQHDGLNWNGLFLYASERTPITGSPSNFIEGFVEMNLLYREDKWFEDYLVFGEGNMDLYVRQVSTGDFQIIDRVPGNLIETVSSFDELLIKALKAHL